MMTSDQLVKLKRSLILHEGHKNFPYTDSVGKLTIGIGYNLTDRGLSDDWVTAQYNADVTYFYNQLSELSFWKKLNPDRQIVLLDMAFMGWKKFLGFKKMLAALEIGDYNKAADEMLNSLWADQVKGRAVDLANAMRTGIYLI